MHKKVLRAVALFMAALMVISGMGPQAQSFAASKYEADGQFATTYSLSELTSAGGYGFTSEATETATVLTFAGQYQEARYAIPAEVLSADLLSIKVNLEGSAGFLAVKVRDDNAEAAELGVTYGNNTIAVAEDIKENVTQVALMNLAEGEASLAVTGITFFTANDTGVEEGEAPVKPSLPEVITEPTNDMVFCDRWSGAENPSGNALVFNGQYQEYVYYLPAPIAEGDLESLTIKVSNQGNNVCFKAYDSAMSETVLNYNNFGQTEYTFAPSTEVAAIGVMSMAANQDEYPYGVVIEAIEAKEVEKTRYITINGEDMTLFNRWNAEETCNNNVVFQSQYHEFLLDLGEEISGREATSIKVDVSNQEKNICIKLLDSYEGGAAELYCNYGNFGQSTYEINPAFEENFRYLVVMSLDADGEENYPFGITLDKVTVQIDPYEAPIYEESTNYKAEELVFLPTDEGTTVEGNVITFSKQWNECRFQLPKSVKAEDVKAVTFNFADPTGRLSFKTYNDAAETAAMYDQSGKKAYTFKPGLSSGDVTHVAVMAHDDNEEHYPFSVTIESIDVLVDTTPAELRVEKGVEYDIVNLRDAMTAVMGEDFIVGTAISTAEFADSMEMELVTKHFNGVTLGNELKPDSMLKANAEITTVELNGEEIPFPVLNFSTPDRYLDFFVNWNEEHPEKFIRIRGHVLVWHSQTPDFFFREDYDTNKGYVTPEVMNKRLECYIRAVCEHYTSADSKYKDLFYGWDVVNEAISDSTRTYRSANENSTWWRVYNSPEFINNAFVYANRYMPEHIALFYNDYNANQPGKCEGICNLVKNVKATPGSRIDGVGMQGHYYNANNNPTMETVKNAAIEYSKLVDQIQFTEVDFKESWEKDDDQLAKRYKDLYDTIRRLVNEGVNVTGFTVWGVVDKHSWLQTANGAGGGSSTSKTQYPLLFDNNYKAKKAFYALANAGELTPEIRNINVVQNINNDYSLGEKFFIEDKAAFTALWKEGEIRVLVDVNDDTFDESDEIAVYAFDGNEIVKAAVNRKDAKEVEGGYEAELILNVDAEALEASMVKMDVKVVDGEKVFAFNDTTFSQDEKADFYADITTKPLLGVQKGTITVDGLDTDAAWANVEYMPLTINLGAEVSANAKLLWDEENLYVLFDVEDSILDKTGSQVHERDSVEIFIDENNHKTGGYEEDDKQYRIDYENEHSFNGTKCVEENIKSEVTLTDKGYRVEAALKWTDIEAVENTMVGLELQVNDAKNGTRTGTLSWADKSGNGYQYTSVFGTIVLRPGVAKNGIFEEDGTLYYYEDGKRVYAGLIQIGDDFYYVQGGGVVSTGSYYITHGNGIMERDHAQFGPDGKMILNGIVKIRDEYYYYENSRPVENLGLIFWNQYHYYIGEGGKAMTGMVDVVKANGIVNEGIHEFKEDGKMVLEGIIMINGKLRYYKGGAMRSQQGMIELEDANGEKALYYVGAGAEVATGKRSVGSRHNNLVEPGMHYFDEVTGKFIR